MRSDPGCCVEVLCPTLISVATLFRQPFFPLFVSLTSSTEFGSWSELEDNRESEMVRLLSFMCTADGSHQREIRAQKVVLWGVGVISGNLFYILVNNKNIMVIY